jgi:hypothetical protein
LLDQFKFLASGQFVFHGVLVSIHMAIQAVEVTGPGNLPYKDNRGSGRLWSGRSKLAESAKVIDNQMASVFFGQEAPEYRTVCSQPDPEHFQ